MPSAFDRTPVGTHGSEPLVTVVVLNYNGLDDTLKCLASLRDVQYTNLSVMVVDNGSRIDPGVDSERVFPGVDVIRTGANLGYAGGNNRGIELALEAGAELVLILNNDTIVDPMIVRRLVDEMSAAPTVGILGSVINFMDEPGVVMTDGVVFNGGPGTAFFDRVEVPLAEGPAVRVDIVNGCCMMVRAEVFRRIGLLDEGFFIVHEESDFCLRARRVGYECAVLGRTLVWHKGSSSFERTGRQLQRYFDARNLFYLLRRHAGRTPHSRSLWPSLFHYAKYVFYRYAVERESGKGAAAAAVAEGIADALDGRTGPHMPGRRPRAWLIGLALSAGYAISRARRSVPSQTSPLGRVDGRAL